MGNFKSSYPGNGRMHPAIGQMNRDRKNRMVVYSDLEKNFCVVKWIEFGQQA